MKRVLSAMLLAVLCVCFALSAWACDKDVAAAQTLGEIYAAAVHDTPTITDCAVASGFDLGTIRFAFYSPATGWVEDVNAAPFDENKPTVIHSHGQGGDDYMFTPDTLYEEGYNVISFLWGTLADDMDVLRIEKRIWQHIDDYVDYNQDMAIVSEEGFNCTVPEIFVARYCDFFALHPGYNRSIRLTGHSYGGQLTLALSAYLTNLFLKGRLPANLLPERYTLLDPYFDNYNQVFECAWLDTSIQYSSLGAAIYCLNNIIFPNNVAIEMLRTSNLVELACIMGINDANAPNYFSQMKPLLRVVELANKNDLRRQFGTSPQQIIYGSGFLHTIANDFYFSPNAKSVYSDSDGVEIFGRANSASLVLATKGMRFDFNIDATDYRLYQNVTIRRVPHEVLDAEGESAEEDAEDKEARAAKEEEAFNAVTVVAGLVASDANGNGQFDEIARDRLTDATVTIKDKKTGKTQTVKTVAGYYCFEATRGATYTVTVNAKNYKKQEITLTANAFVNLADFALTTR